MNELAGKHCRSDVSPLSEGDAKQLLASLDDWTQGSDGKQIQREFHFKNYYQTIAFVNALAWIAHREDHHPDLGVHYNKCSVRFSTHSVGGLSENDFICAAKLDALIQN